MTKENRSIQVLQPDDKPSEDAIVIRQTSPTSYLIEFDQTEVNIGESDSLFVKMIVINTMDSQIPDVIVETNRYLHKIGDDIYAFTSQDNKLQVEKVAEESL